MGGEKVAAFTQLIGGGQKVLAVGKKSIPWSPQVGVRVRVVGDMLFIGELAIELNGGMVDSVGKYSFRLDLVGRDRQPGKLRVLIAQPPTLPA